MHLLNLLDPYLILCLQFATHLIHMNCIVLLTKRRHNISHEAWRVLTTSSSSSRSTTLFLCKHISPREKNGRTQLKKLKFFK